VIALKTFVRLFNYRSCTGNNGEATAQGKRGGGGCCGEELGDIGGLSNG